MAAFCSLKKVIIRKLMCLHYKLSMLFSLKDNDGLVCEEYAWYDSLKERGKGVQG
jgi:hypothetical protein